MWLRFHKAFDWRQPGFTIAYPVGLYNVTRQCAAAAIVAKAAEPTKDRPNAKTQEGGCRLAE
ncbi:hypothetical protein SAMN03159422_00221 [Agrobacterium fabrum]|jgi:hypothetical protein|nr:hypothetical protein SAMN03159422_00221 [Agrobacterium fabrum]SEQ22829.1 hypothetical protein SAMN03159504_00221 [Agrobacterium fabrum]